MQPARGGQAVNIILETPCCGFTPSNTNYYYRYYYDYYYSAAIPWQRVQLRASIIGDVTRHLREGFRL